jgi:glycogen operon protein
MSRTQRGNNNAYCQDNDLSWLDWSLRERNGQLIDFVRGLAELRRRHPLLRRRSFFQGRSIVGPEIKDIVWLNPDGHEMSDQEWGQSFARCLGMVLAGRAIDEQDHRGQPLIDDDLLILMNAHHEAIPFTLPGPQEAAPWHAMLDTHHDSGLAPEGRFRASEIYPLQGRSFVLLIRFRADI